MNNKYILMYEFPEFDMPRHTTLTYNGAAKFHDNMYNFVIDSRIGSNKGALWQLSTDAATVFLLDPKNLHDKDRFIYELSGKLPEYPAINATRGRILKGFQDSMIGQRWVEQINDWWDEYRKLNDLT